MGPVDNEKYAQSKFKTVSHCYCVVAIVLSLVMLQLAEDVKRWNSADEDNFTQVCHRSIFNSIYYIA